MAGNSEKNTTSENAKGWFILGFVFLGLAWLIWHYFEYDIKSAIRWIHYGEMWLISHFLSEDYTVPLGRGVASFEQWFQVVPELKKTQLDGGTMSNIAIIALYPWRWIFIAIMVVMGLWAMFAGPGTEYRQVMGIDMLIKFQAKNFPVIAPFVKFNPSNIPPRPPGSPVPAELPLFAEALGPEEWLAFNNIPLPDGKVDQVAAFRAFARQLGPRWRGPKYLEDYKQVLMAAFCLKAARKRDQSDQMLGRIAQCWTHDKGLQLSKDRKLLREARSILKNKKLSDVALRKANQHGFETTAMLRALATAREEGGVLAPAQFVWLRAHNRDLWYALNNLGRQSFHMEALGSMAHYKVEKLIQRPIPRPKVHTAVQTITEYMESIRARPIPQLDYSGSRKKSLKKPRAGVQKPALPAKTSAAKKLKSA